MYKLIDSSSFFDSEDLQVTLLNAPGSTDTLIKVAADERVTSYVMEGLKPEPGKMYLHINAMGAGEFYGPNRNGDYFPEEVLKKYYKTFETSPAHVFRHHINKDPARAIGKVLFAIYNERMHRVELVAEVDRVLGKDVEDRIAAGDFPATSMACKTPYDVCSICNNKAHTLQEYCVHLKQHLGRVMPDGKRVMALNVAPLRFFDISIVVKPADITSSILQKVAHDTPAISSLILGEEEGLSFDEDREKAAALGKISELTKEIEGYVAGSDPSLESILSQVKDPAPESIHRLDAVPLEDLFQTFGELGISPSIKTLAELIAYRMGHTSPDIGSQVVEALRTSKISDVKTPTVEMESDREVNPLVKKALASFQGECSIFPEFIEKRASFGYAGMGPNIVPTEAEIRQDERRRMAAMQPQPNMLTHPLTVLLTIGGAALWAKAYINSIIDKRLMDMHAVNRQTLVKMANVSAAKELSAKDVAHKAEGTALSRSLSVATHPLAKKVNLAVKIVSVAQNKLQKSQ